MNNQLTVGEKKSYENKLPYLGKEIKKPSFYGTGFEDKFEDERDEISYDDNAVSLQKSVISTIRDNRRDIEQLNSAREAALYDVTETPHASAAAVYEFSQEISDRIYKRSARVESNLREYREKITNSIDSEIRKEANRNANHTSNIQAYLLNNLDDKADRMSFLRTAIKEQDDKTIAAVLESPAYLSGLDKDDVRHLRELYVKSRYADRMKIADYVENLANHVGDGYNTWLSNAKVLESQEVKNAIQSRNKAKAARKLG